ncbi:Gar1/Naf1 RNA binding region-domain-containing protein, partial [Delphinella strobiligena]
MEDAGEDDDGGQKVTNNHQVRTKNEKPDDIIPKPDVTVTPDMKITPLGNVENVVDTMILVKANTSGEYQVLEAGSVLCLENREVIGAVAETLGRVQEPLYVIAFT